MKKLLFYLFLQFVFFFPINAGKYLGWPPVNPDDFKEIQQWTIIFDRFTNGCRGYENSLDNQGKQLDIRVATIENDYFIQGLQRKDQQVWFMAEMREDVLVLPVSQIGFLAVNDEAYYLKCVEFEEHSDGISTNTGTFCTNYVRAKTFINEMYLYFDYESGCYKPETTYGNKYGLIAIDNPEQITDIQIGSTYYSRDYDYTTSKIFFESEADYDAVSAYLNFKIFPQKDNIHSIHYNTLDNSNSIYDLLGRPVSVSNIKSGIYIKNGKKFIVK